jgi:AraC-like DNA-binding protein
MMIDLIALSRGIIQLLLPLAVNQAERNLKVIQLKRRFNLQPEHLSDNFYDAYAYTLLEYSLEKKEEALIRLFAETNIRDAFRVAVFQNNQIILENTVAETINWEDRDWNTLGDEIRNLALPAQHKTLEDYIHEEIETFGRIFYDRVIPLILRPSDLVNITNISDIRELLIEIQQALRNQAIVLNNSNLIPQISYYLDNRIRNQLQELIYDRETITHEQIYIPLNIKPINNQEQSPSNLDIEQPINQWTETLID